MKKSCSTCTVNLKKCDQMLTEYYFAVRYGDIFAKEHDMCMTEAQIQGANNT